MKGRLVGAVVTAAAVGLFACAEPSTVRRTAEPAPTPRAAPGRSVVEIATSYLRAYASQRPETMASMLDLTEPGSTAGAYAVHQNALAGARRAADVFLREGRVTVQNEAVKVCFDVCATYGNFVGDAEKERLRNFTIDASRLEGRLGLGDGSTRTAGGARFEVVSAYRTISGNALFVPIHVDDISKRIGFQQRASYVTKRGQRASAQQLLGPATVEPRTDATIAVVFPGLDLGGTVRLNLRVEDANEFVDLPVPVALDQRR